jgi:hypothetical protein
VAATSKPELAELCEREYHKLSQLLDRIDPSASLIKDDDDTSIKYVVAHRAHWIDLFLGRYHDGLAGQEVNFPAKGYKWNDLKRYNADLRAQQADLSWDDARSLLAEQYRRLSDFIADATDEQLYSAPMVGANNDWPAGRWAEAAGPSHFRSAGKYIRARLRNG